jgi:hypothetical protein
VKRSRPGIREDQLANERYPDLIGEHTRFFFEGPPLELRRARRRARKLPGVAVVDESRTAGDYCWTLTFTWRGYTFHIDMNHHAAVSLFFVNDPECPSEILLGVLNHFDRVSEFPFAGSGAPDGRTLMSTRLWILLAIPAFGVLIAPLIALILLAQRGCN